jgi:hypothetical protein
VATLITFFSVVGAITVLCGIINTLSLLSVVPSADTTVFPLGGVNIEKGRAMSLQALRERRARRHKEARGAWLKFGSS